MSFIVTIEYKGDDYPPNLDKKVLRAINQVLQGYTLKTNLGVDIQSSEGRHIKGKQHWEGIELARLDPIPEVKHPEKILIEAISNAKTIIYNLCNNLEKRDGIDLQSTLDKELDIYYRSLITPDERMIKAVGNDSRDIASTANYIYTEIMEYWKGDYFKVDSELAAAVAVEFCNEYPYGTEWESKTLDWESRLCEFYAKYIEKRNEKNTK